MSDILTLIDTGVIVPGQEYYSRRTDGWKWFDGQEHWWEVFVVFQNGMHGGCGACVEERWRWNGSSQTIRRDYRNLSYEETCELVDKILEQRPIAQEQASDREPTKSRSILRREAAQRGEEPPEFSSGRGEVT